MSVADHLSDLVGLAEDVDFEAKAAQGRDGDGEVPRSMWETYSAMANTDGGIILLGVKQEKDGSLTPVGLNRINRIRKSFWDQVHDRHVVNINLLQESDVQVVETNGKRLLRIRVPRASRSQRPVHLGANPLGGTFRRNYEGDYRCDATTVRRMLAEAVEDARDARLLEGFGLDDLDRESLAAYRNEFRSTRPGHPWIGLDDQELLRNLSAWSRDRQSGQEGLTLAGLLMFGKLRAILESLPNYIVDYQERPVASTHIRWDDRLTTDGTWSGNLYDFFRLSYRKLTAELKVPFRLEAGFKRIDESYVHEALREALVNALIHADYTGTVSILVIKQPDGFVFRNPGGLRLPVPVILAGGTSDCRNRWLQKMFQLIGAGEQAGSGFPKILRAWREQHWRTPLLRDDIQPEQTILQLPMISLLPQAALDELDRRFGEDFRHLGEFERLALATALTEGRVTNERLRQITAEHSSDLTVLLRKLVDRGMLLPSGSGRWTLYRLPASQTESLVELPLWPSIPVVGTSFEASTASSEHSGSSSEHSGASSEHWLVRSEQAAVASSEQIEINEEYLEPLENLARPVRVVSKVPRAAMEQMILQLCSERYLTLRELARLLGRTADTLRVHYLSRMVKEASLELRFPDQRHHPVQGYRVRKQR